MWLAKIFVRKNAKPLGLEEAELFTFAGYLLLEASTGVESETHIRKLDPYVAGVLAQEPVATQRTVIGILSILKSIAKGIEEYPYCEFEHTCAQAISID